MTSITVRLYKEKFLPCNCSPETYVIQCCSLLFLTKEFVASLTMSTQKSWFALVCLGSVLSIDWLSRAMWDPRDNMSYKGASWLAPRSHSHRYTLLAIKAIQDGPSWFYTRSGRRRHAHRCDVSKIAQYTEGRSSNSRAVSLYGITSIQTFLYFHGYKKDMILVKTMVRVITLCSLDQWLCRIPHPSYVGI